MTKLSFTVSLPGYLCTALNDTTAEILGAENGVPVNSLLADEQEFDTLKAHVQSLIDGEHGVFETLNLVFSAPNAPSGSDRSP